MFIKRSALFVFIGSLLIASACSNAQDNGKPTKQPAEQSAHPSSENEMVEIIIRMPDGRVIVRKEPKNASRIDPDTLDKRLQLAKSTKKSAGKVNTLEQAITGGSNGSGSSLPTAGGGGGGGSSSGGGSLGGGGGGSRGTQNDSSGSDDSNNANSHSIPTIQPDNDYTVRIYAWRNSGAPFKNAVRTYIASPKNKSPKELATEIAHQIAVEKPGEIVIRFWKEFYPADRYPFDLSNPQELINSGGFKQGLTEYWAEFARELKAQNIYPDYLVHDMEDSINYWYIPSDQRRFFFQSIINPSQPLTTQIPESMRNISIDQFLKPRDPVARLAIRDWNEFAAKLRTQLLHDVFSQAFTDAYGEYIPISNYRDFLPSREVEMYSARPFPSSSTGGISAPSLYIKDLPEWGRYRGIAKDIRWNRFIDCLNEARSASTTGLVTPWIAAPGFGVVGDESWARSDELEGEYEIWEMLMDHLLAMGIDTFILWNPPPRYNPNAIETDEFVDQWLANNPRAAGPQLRNLPEIPLDADSITTNGVTTTYQQFIEALGLN